MPKFIIKQFETVVNKYEVEADNKMQALLDFRMNMAGDFIAKEDLDPIICNEYGLSFEDLEEQGFTHKEIEQLRKEFNDNKRYDYLESICAIEEVVE